MKLKLFIMAMLIFTSTITQAEDSQLGANVNDIIRVNQMGNFDEAYDNYVNAFRAHTHAMIMVNKQEAKHDKVLLKVRVKEIEKKEELEESIEQLLSSDIMKGSIVSAEDLEMQLLKKHHILEQEVPEFLGEKRINHKFSIDGSLKNPRDKAYILKAQDLKSKLINDIDADSLNLGSEAVSK